MGQYRFAGRSGLSASELFFWIVVDTTADPLGVDDIAAVIAILLGQPILPTRGKLGGATRGTSPVSSFWRATSTSGFPFACRP